MSLHLRSITLACCATLLLSSCDDDGGPSIAIEDVPARLAAVMCGLVETCFTADLWAMYMQSVGATDCVANLTQEFENDELVKWQAALTAGRAEYHGTKVQACLDDIASFDCTDLGTTRMPAVCEDAITGLVAVGGECEEDADCVDNAFCDLPAACPGTCTDPGAAEADCASDDHCADGLTCDDDLCVAPAADGDACGGDDHPDCQLGYVCAGENSDTGASGICVLATEAFGGVLDATCDPGAGEFCETGLTCALQGEPGWKCVTSSASGAACKISFPNPCPEGEYCSGVNVSPFDNDGTCQAAPDEGDPCGVPFNACAPGFVCVAASSVCATRKANGAICIDSDECYSGSCDSGTGQCAVDLGCMTR